MKKTMITLIAVLLLALTFTSCTNDIKDPEKIFSGESWAEIFEEYWTVMDEEYVHFSYEETDWDAVYDEYAPAFSLLDYSNADDCFTAFGYFNHILLNLSDYHYRLIIETKSGYTYDARPSLLNKWKKTGGDVDELPDIRTGKTSASYVYYSVKGGKNSPITSSVRTAEYLDKAVDGYSEVTKLKENGAFHTSSSVVFLETGEAEFPDSSNLSMFYKFVVSPFELDDTSWFCGVTKSGVLYIYFSKFVKPGLLDYFYSLYNYDSLTPREQEAFVKNYSKEKKCYDMVMASSESEEKKLITGICRYATWLKDAVSSSRVTLGNGSTVDIKGIVIDLRNNGGGYAAFYQEFMGLFFASDRTVGYTQMKTGFSRYDTGPWVEYRLGTYNTSLKEDYSGRVAVITNGWSVSCSELTTITTKLLPSSLRFGSTTFGGTCALMDRTVYHSGPYTHGSLTVRTTTVRYKASDGTSYEAVGIVPDVEIPLDTEKDVRFEAAVQWAATETLPPSAT